MSVYYWPVDPNPPEPLVVSESSSDSWYEIGSSVGPQIWKSLVPA